MRPPLELFLVVLFLVVLGEWELLSSVQSSSCSSSSLPTENFADASEDSLCLLLPCACEFRSGVVGLPALPSWVPESPLRFNESVDEFLLTEVFDPTRGRLTFELSRRISVVLGLVDGVRSFAFE